MKQIRHVATEVTIILMAISIGLRIIIWVTRVLLSIDKLRTGTNPVVTLQNINSMVE